MKLRSGFRLTRLGAVAICGLALATSREFYVRSIAPLRQQEAEARLEVADLNGRLDEARKTIAAVREREKDAHGVPGDLERLQDDLPAGSRIVWMSALLEGHFAHAGTPVLLNRLNLIRDEPNLPDYQRSFWSMALPVEDTGLNIAQLLFAVEDLEEQHPFLRVLDFAIRPDPENPDRQLAVLNLSALLPK